MENKKQTQLPIIFSERFKNTLNNITHQISDYLLSNEGILNSSYSYIDIGKNCDSVSFIQANKAEDLLKNNPDNKDIVWTSLRCDTKIGKFLNSLLGSIFRNNTQRSGLKLKPDDIESFVNKYKIEFTFDDFVKHFEIVEGNAIKFWYLEDNYSQVALNSSTTLGNSCMRYYKYQKFTDIYKDNPEKIKMLILKDTENKLLGRALLWYLDVPEGKIFMDRIYTAEDKITDLFKKYAATNKWYYKSYQTYGYEHALVDTNETPFKLVTPIVSVQLKDQYYRFLPYLDTLAVLDTNKKILSNDGNLIEKSGYMHCIGSNGISVIDIENINSNKIYDEDNNEINDEDNDEEYVYSHYHGRNILRNEARYCEFGNDWILSDEALFVYNSGQRYAIPGTSMIVYSQYSNKWFMRDKVVFSDYYNTYLFHDSAIKVWKDINRRGYIILHKNDYDKYFEHSDVYYLSELKKELYDKLDEYNKSKGERYSDSTSIEQYLDDEDFPQEDRQESRLVQALRRNDRQNEQREGVLYSEPTVRHTQPPLRFRNRRNEPVSEPVSEPVAEIRSEPVAEIRSEPVAEININNLFENINRIDLDRSYNQRQRYYYNVQGGRFTQVERNTPTDNSTNNNTTSNDVA